jgi:hypothetical protein
MTNDTVNKIILWAAIGTIILTVIGTIDFFFNKWKHFKRFFAWLGDLLPQLNAAPVELHIPPPARPVVTTPRPEDTIIRLSKAFEKARTADPVVTHPGTRLGATSPDGVTKVLKRNIMCPTQGQLLAFETTRFGFSGTHYLVERHIGGESQPRYKLTPNKDEANAQWFEWFDEMKKKGFGGCSGTGMDGTRPF